MRGRAEAFGNEEAEGVTVDNLTRVHFYTHPSEACDRIEQLEQELARLRLGTAVTQAERPAYLNGHCTCWLGIPDATCGSSVEREQCAVHGLAQEGGGE